MTKDILIKGSYNGNKVPKGFLQWYKIVEGYKNEVSINVNSALSNNDLFGAVLIYDEVTGDNKEKNWH